MELDFPPEEKREDVFWKKYAAVDDTIQVLKYYKPCWEVEGTVTTTIEGWRCVECDVPISQLRPGFRVEPESTLWTTPTRRTVDFEDGEEGLTGRVIVTARGVKTPYEISLKNYSCSQDISCPGSIG